MSASTAAANTAESSEHQHLQKEVSNLAQHLVVFATTYIWSPLAGVGERSRGGKDKMPQEHVLLDVFTT